MSGALLDLVTPVQDGLAWLVIGAVMLIYLKQHGLISQNSHVAPMVNVDEPDVSRWRHNGQQPYDWNTGNRASIRDETAYELGGQIGV
jgi:hypothetical protein